MEVIPAGIYELTVHAVDYMHSALDDSNVFAIELHFEDGIAFAYAADNEGARRAFWGDLADSFRELPTIEGRTFLFPINIVTLSGSVTINHVQAPLAEVIHEG